MDIEKHENLLTYRFLRVDGKILYDIFGSHSCMSILCQHKILGNLGLLPQGIVVSTWLLFDERYNFCHHLKMVKVS